MNSQKQACSEREECLRFKGVEVAGKQPERRKGVDLVANYDRSLDRCAPVHFGPAVSGRYFVAIFVFFNPLLAMNFGWCF